MAEVEAGLLAAVEGETGLAGDAVRTLNAGGKRMRPMLSVLLCAGGGRPGCGPFGDRGRADSHGQSGPR